MLLSEENMRMHTEYAKTVRLKYSIIEKSEKKLQGKRLIEIPFLKIDRNLKSEAYGLLLESTLHETFFSSFSEVENKRSAIIERDYGSVGSFLNGIYKLGMDMKYGFISIGLKKGRAVFEPIYEYGERIITYLPVLTVDICEHSYFFDYGFDKSRYLYMMLSHLMLDKLDKVTEEL